MTGFARAEGATDTANWYWEARSVNGKGLDVRLRLPPGTEELETAIRQGVAQAFKRGNVSVNLSLQRRTGGVEIRVNEEGLAQVLAAAKRVEDALGPGPALSADALLNVRGVLETVEAEESEEARQLRSEELLATFGACLEDLARSRRSEGAKIADVLSRHVEEIEALVGKIAASPARQPEAIASRLAALVSRLRSADETLDPDRLHQEAVLIATRVDVEEEISRLHAHIKAARELLAEDAAVGRRLDFLAQEFNREANTICSKSNDIEITQAGMALKVVIDQLREQVQNVE